MNKYIIYTTEGYCENPKCEDVNNCQVLGRALGETEYQAVKSFLQANDWVISMGYKPENFIVARLHDSENV